MKGKNKKMLKEPLWNVAPSVPFMRERDKANDCFRSVQVEGGHFDKFISSASMITLQSPP